MAGIAGGIVLLVLLILYGLNRILVRKTRETDEELKHNLKIFSNRLVEDISAAVNAAHDESMRQLRLLAERLEQSDRKHRELQDKTEQELLAFRASVETLAGSVEAFKQQYQDLADGLGAPGRGADALTDAVSGIRDQIDRQENLMRKLVSEYREQGREIEKRLEEMRGLAKEAENLGEQPARKDQKSKA
jgi:methyl-accepting chemotaxis protein